MPVKPSEPERQFSLPYSREIYNVLESPRADVLDAVLVLTGGFIFGLKSLEGWSVYADLSLRLVEDAIVIFFAIEYFLRWYSREFDLRFVLEPLSIIRFLSFAPFTYLLYQKYVLGDPSVDPFEASLYSVLSLFTVLRLQSFVKDVGSFEKFLEALSIPKRGTRYALRWQFELARVALTVVSLLAISSGLFYELEHKTNPSIPDGFTALYFSIETITTVGYGDVTLATPGGRFVLCMYILVGAAIIPFQLAKLGEALLDEDRDKPMLRSDSSPIIFRRYDLNNDGRVDMQEASLLFRDANVPGIDVQKTVRDMDVDGDGGIDLYELDRGLPSPVRDKLIGRPRLSAEAGAATMSDALITREEREEREDRTPNSSAFKADVCQTCGESMHLAQANFCFMCGSPMKS